MHKKNHIATVLFFVLQCVFARLSLADGYHFFEHYTLMPDSQYCQFKGYIAVRYSVTQGTTPDSPTSIEGDRHSIPVANGRVIAKDELDRGRTVLLRPTKFSSSSPSRVSKNSSSSGSGTSPVSHENILTFNFSDRRPSRRSNTSNNGASLAGTSTCTDPVLNDALNSKQNSVAFEWRANQEASAVTKGTLTILSKDFESVILENVYQSGLHEFTFVHEQDQTQSESHWVTQLSNTELSDEDKATLRRGLKRSLTRDKLKKLEKFIFATSLAATRSAFEPDYPDPIWGTNCNWEHIAFYMLDTDQIGWELINSSEDAQHEFLMPTNIVPEHVLETITYMGGTISPDDLNITIVHDQTAVELTSESGDTHTQMSCAQTPPPVLEKAEEKKPQPPKRSQSFSVITTMTNYYHALADQEFHDRDFFLQLLDGAISQRADLVATTRKRLRDSIPGQITEELIEELIELAIIARPESFTGPVIKKDHNRNDEDPGSGSGSAGGSSNGGVTARNNKDRNQQQSTHTDTASGGGKQNSNQATFAGTYSLKEVKALNRSNPVHFSEAISKQQNYPLLLQPLLQAQSQ